MDSLIQDLLNVVLFSMWGFAMFSVLHKRWSYALSIPVFALTIAMIKLACVFIPLSVFRFPVSVAVFIAAVLFLFTDRPLRKLLLLSGCYTTMMIAELIYTVLFFGPDAVSDGFSAIPVNQQIVFCLTYLFGSGILLYLLVLMFRKAGGEDCKEGIILLIMLLLQIVLFFVCYTPVATDTSPTRTRMIVTYLITCICMDIAIVLTFRAMKRRAELASENLALEKLVAAQETHYQDLAVQYESIRNMRHDIANHLYTMRILIENGQTEEASRYADEIGSSTARGASLAGCMNPVLDSFLSHRLRELEEKGIRVTARISVPAKPVLTNAELISAFGNLLDNAEEACFGMENAFIELSSEYREPYLCIELKNSCAEKTDARNKKRRIPEIERGVGTKILSSMAEKHGGEFRLTEDNGVCSSVLILREGDSLCSE